MSKLLLRQSTLCPQLPKALAEALTASAAIVDMRHAATVLHPLHPVCTTSGTSVIGGGPMSKLDRSILVVAIAALAVACGGGSATHTLKLTIVNTAAFRGDPCSDGSKGNALHDAEVKIEDNTGAVQSTATLASSSKYVAGPGCSWTVDLSGIKDSPVYTLSLQRPGEAPSTKDFNKSDLEQQHWEVALSLYQG